jgi:hypothetical protein
MINESRYAALRPLHPIQDKSPLAELLFEADVRRADNWLAIVAGRQSQRRELQRQLDDLDLASERNVLVPLRSAADAALAAHIAASAALETARIECEAKGTPLRNQIDALTRQMAAPEFPTPTVWKDSDAPQIDAREAAAAAATPMQAGGIPFEPTVN